MPRTAPRGRRRDRPTRVHRMDARKRYVHLYAGAHIVCARLTSRSILLFLFLSVIFATLQPHSSFNDFWTRTSKLYVRIVGGNSISWNAGCKLFEIKNIIFSEIIFTPVAYLQAAISSEMNSKNKRTRFLIGITATMQSCKRLLKQSH